MQENHSSNTQNNRSIHQLLGSFFTLFQDRIELIGIELSEGKEHFLSLCLIALLTAVLSLFAIASLTVLIIVLFWETYRWQTLLAVFLSYTFLTTICAICLYRKIKHGPIFLQHTLDQFQKDKSLFQSSSTPDAD